MPIRRELGGSQFTKFEFNEGLIEYYKELHRLAKCGLSQDDALELLSVSIILTQQGYTLAGDDEDWMPSFTPDAH